MFTTQNTYQPLQFQSSPIVPKPMTDDWRRWIAENKMLGVSDDALFRIMILDGIDTIIARAEIEAVAQHPYFLAAQNVARAHQKTSSYHDLRVKLTELAPSHGQIERRSNLSAQEFLENYYITGTPVIITDLMQDWPAMNSWTPEQLESRFGNLQIQVQTNRNADPNYEINSERHKQLLPMSEYVDLVVNGGETNDYYMVANNSDVNNQVLQSVYEDIGIPPYLDPNLLEGRSFFWFGPKGTITPYHHDPANLMMAQVYGRKRWKLVSPFQTHLMYNNIGVFSEVDAEHPDYTKYPLYQKVNVIECDVQPGEIIFMPVGWWHHVRSLDICISMSFTNLVFPNYFNYA